MGSYHAKFDAELESIAKSAKSLAKKYIGRKVLQAVKNSIFGAFSWLFICMFFATFFNRFEISSKFCFFDTHVAFLKEKMFFHISTFYKFWRQTRTTQMKQTENFFLYMCLKIKFCNHQWPGRTKLLNSLSPILLLFSETIFQKWC